MADTILQCNAVAEGQVAARGGGQAGPRQAPPQNNRAASVYPTSADPCLLDAAVGSGTPRACGSSATLCWASPGAPAGSAVCYDRVWCVASCSQRCCAPARLAACALLKDSHIASDRYPISASRDLKHPVVPCLRLTWTSVNRRVRIQHQCKWKCKCK